jgi:hypothetical protein
VKPGPVIYIAGEGQAGITRRLRAWQIRNDINLDDAPLYVSLHPAQLVNRESARAVLDAVKRVADSVGEPAMVIIDTLARNFGPGDENSTQDMNAAIEAADAIRANWGPVVLFIHHTGHGEKGRARGASSFRAALDTELRLDKDEDGVVRLEATKTKDGRPPEPMAFTINTVELGIFDDEGEELDSAILNPTDYEPPQTKKPRPLGDTQKLLLETLETVTETHRENLQADGRDPETARVTVADWREACRRKGVKRNRFHEAKKSLEKREYVTVESGFVRRVRPNQASVRTPFKGGFGHDGRSAPGHFGRESDDSSDAPSDGGEEEGEIL